MGIFDDLSEGFEEIGSGVKEIIVDPVTEWAQHYQEQVGESWSSAASDIAKRPQTILTRTAQAVNETVTPIAEATQVIERVPIVGEIARRNRAYREFQDSLAAVQAGSGFVSDLGGVTEQAYYAAFDRDKFNQESLIESSVGALATAARYNPKFGGQVRFAEEVTGVNVEDVLRDIATKSASGDFEGLADVPLDQLEAGIERKLGPQLFNAIMGNDDAEQQDSATDIKSMLAKGKNDVFSPILPWDCSTYNMLTENPQYLDTLVRFTAHESSFPEAVVEREIITWWKKMKRVCEQGASDVYIQEPPFQLSNPAHVLVSQAQPDISYNTIRGLSESMSGRVGSYMSALMTGTGQPMNVKLFSILSALPWKGAVTDYPKLTMGSWRNFEIMPPEIRHWILEHERISGVRPYDVFSEPDGSYIMNVPTSATYQELQANMGSFPIDATDIVLVSSGRGAFAAERMSMMDPRVRVIAIDGYVTGRASKERILQIVTGRDPLAAMHSITPYNAYIGEQASPQSSASSAEAGAEDLEA